MKLGESLVDLGNKIIGGDPVPPGQIGTFLVHVGQGVTRLERKLEAIPALEARVEELEAALDTQRVAKDRERRAYLNRGGK